MSLTWEERRPREGSSSGRPRTVLERLGQIQDELTPGRRAPRIQLRREEDPPRAGAALGPAVLRRGPAPKARRRRRRPPATRGPGAASPETKPRPIRDRRCPRWVASEAGRLGWSVAPGPLLTNLPARLRDPTSTGTLNLPRCSHTRRPPPFGAEKHPSGCLD